MPDSEYKCHICAKGKSVDQMVFLDSTLKFPLMCQRCENEQMDPETNDPEMHKFLALLTFRKVISIITENRTTEKHEELLQYREVVFPKPDLDIWMSRLQSIFGEPRKPIGTEADLFQRQITEDFGGIERHQALYYAEYGNYRVMALVWPWRDNESVTFKGAIVRS